MTFSQDQMFIYSNHGNDRGRKSLNVQYLKGQCRPLFIAVTVPALSTTACVREVTNYAVIVSS